MRVGVRALDRDRGADQLPSHRDHSAGGGATYNMWV